MAVIYETPLLNPAPGGLYTVAALLDAGDVPRLWDGVRLRSLNCGGSVNLEPLALCDPALEPREVPDRPTDRGFEGFHVWTGDSCGGLTGNPDEQKTRAEQVLRLRERVVVEAQAAAMLASVTGAGTPVTGGLPAALGALETEARLTGITPTLHVPMKFGAQLDALNLLHPSGPNWMSAMGSQFAFGAGYDVLGDTWIATGPVTIWRSSTVVEKGIDPTTNARIWIASRNVLVAFECYAYAVTIA